ncbi:MAG: hypothetical protein HWE33_09365 [Rhodobacteraceae bacterium]|nr:hypothetical protein [Paracoccaceae bacterium]
MTPIFTAATAVTALMAASGAFADGVAYRSVSLSYFTDDSADLEAFLFEGAMDYQLGRFMLSAATTYYDDGDFDGRNFSGSVGYEILPGLTGYVHVTTLDSEMFEETIYGLGVDYIGEILGVALHYGQQDEADNEIYHLLGYVEFGPSTAYGSISRASDENFFFAGYEYAVDTLDVAIGTEWSEEGLDEGNTSVMGHYRFLDRYEIMAGLTSDNDVLLEEGYLDLGFGYALTEALTLEAAYTTTFGEDSPDMDLLTLALTFETGPHRARVVDRYTDFVRDTTTYTNKASGIDLYTPGMSFE